MVHVIHLVWHNASGKTTVAKILTKEFPKLNHLRWDDVREFLIDKVSFFHWVQLSHPSPKMREINKLMRTFRDNVFQVLLKHKQSIILDGSGFYKENRQDRREKFLKWDKNIIYTIIYCKISEYELLPRLKTREKNEQGTKRIEHYKNKRKAKHQEPTPDEADNFIIYTQDNIEEVCRQVSNIIET